MPTFSGRKAAMAAAASSSICSQLSFTRRPRACKLGIEAASCYYPTDIARQYQDQPRCPVVVHFAKRDHIVKPETVEKFMATHPEIPAYLYEADHGFNCWKRPGEGYSPESSALALDRSLSLFARCLGK